jgi:hypothetical protein
MLVFVMNNIGVYCDSFTFRKNLFLRNMFIGTLKQTSMMVKNTLEEAAKAHDQLAMNFQSALEEVKNLSSAQLQNGSANDLSEESDKLLKEVQTMGLTLEKSPIDVRYLGSLIDIYTYIGSFFLKVIFLLVQAAVSSYQPLDITMFSLVLDLFLGILADLSFRQASKFTLITVLVSESCLTTLRILAFVYFGFSRFVLQALQQSEGAQQEEYVIQQIGLTIKNILRDEESYSRSMRRSVKESSTKQKDSNLSCSKKKRPSQVVLYDEQPQVEVVSTLKKSKCDEGRLSPLRSPIRRASTSLRGVDQAPQDAARAY